MCRDGINPLDSTWAQDMVTVKNNAKIQCIFNSLFSVLDIISIQVLILRYKTHKENKFLGNYLEIKSCDICNNSREELNQLMLFNFSLHSHVLRRYLIRLIFPLKLLHLIIKQTHHLFINYSSY